MVNVCCALLSEWITESQRFHGLITPHGYLKLFTWSPPACWNSSCPFSFKLPLPYLRNHLSGHIQSHPGSPAMCWQLALVEPTPYFHMCCILCVGRLSSASRNIGYCRYTCLCVWLCSCTGNGWGSVKKGDVIFYYRSENMIQFSLHMFPGILQGEKKVNPPHPSVTFIDGALVMAELWNVESCLTCESALFCSYWEQHSWE